MFFISSKSYVENAYTRQNFSGLDYFGFVGVLLSVLEAVGAITPISVGGTENELGVGTVAAGIQNFIICIEMFIAAIALRYAFPYQIYQEKQADRGRLGSFCVWIVHIRKRLRVM